MAVLLDNTAYSATNGGTGGATFNHTISSKGNRVLVVAVSGSTSGDTLPAEGFSVTAGGVSMTSRAYKSGYRCYSAIYTLEDPAAGVTSIVTNPNVNSLGTISASYLFYNCKEYDSQAEASGSATGASLNITVAKGGSYVVDAMSNRGSTIGTAGAGQTTVYNASPGGTTACMTSSKPVSSGTQSTSFSDYSNNQYAYASVAVSPSPMGGSFLLNML